VPDNQDKMEALSISTQALVNIISHDVGSSKVTYFK